jgi:hypothetical protein
MAPKLIKPRIVRVGASNGFGLLALALPACLLLTPPEDYKPGEECEPGDTCVEGHYCATWSAEHRGVCTPDGRCAFDANCPEGEFCHEDVGSCHPPECTETDASACQGFRCQLDESSGDHRCYTDCSDADWRDNVYCRDGYVCDFSGYPSQCIPRKCDGYAADPDGVCLTTCEDNNDCERGFLCEVGQCVW